MLRRLQLLVRRFPLSLSLSFQFSASLLESAAYVANLSSSVILRTEKKICASCLALPFIHGGFGLIEVENGQ
jgi:hypothetical protein